MSNETELNNAVSGTSVAKDVPANRVNSCNASNSTALQTSLLFFDSSSDSESDDDAEIVQYLLQARKKLRVYLSVVKGGYTLFFEMESRNCIRRYFEDVMITYTEDEFKRHFRISRDVYEQLCVKFGESDIYNNQRADKRLSEKLYLAVFLWFAGHEACSYRDIADRFDLALGTVWNMIHRVSFHISSSSPSIIKWPDDEQKLNLSNYFKKKCDFARAIGCIDGTHIVIDPPKNGKDDYIDRKGNTSLCLQAVCNEKKEFISIFVGYPGSSHDSWVFQNSPLCTKLSSICQNYYILGDSAYSCSSHLITPYRDNGHLSRSQKKFNMKLSSGRVVIEHSFGILKQRFRQLYYCKICGIKHLCHFIRACCVLHNIAGEDDIIFNEETLLPVQEEYRGIEQSIRGNAIRDAIRQEIEIDV